MMPNKGTNGIINRTQMETNELINNEAWIRKTAAEPEDQDGARGKEEPAKARVMEGRGKAGGVKSHSIGGSTTDKGGAGGTREPCGASVMMGQCGDKGARSQGRADESKD